MSLIRKSFFINNVATDLTSVKLSDRSGIFGVKRNDTGAIVVPDGTDMDHTGTGTYEYEFTDPALGLSYTYALEVVYGGETYWVEDILTRLTPVAPSGVYPTPFSSGNARLDNIVNVRLLARLKAYRNIVVWWEPVERLSDYQGFSRFQTAYTPVNAGYANRVILSQVSEVDWSRFTVESSTGIFTFDASLRTGDYVHITYGFDYFPGSLLAEFVKEAVHLVNLSGTVGTEYSISDMPESWLGLIEEMAFLSCIQKLQLDQNTLANRRIFTLDVKDLQTQFDSVINVTQARIERLVERFKIRPTVTQPTDAYWQSHRSPFFYNPLYGLLLRGWRIR